MLEKGRFERFEIARRDENLFCAERPHPREQDEEHTPTKTIPTSIPHKPAPTNRNPSFIPPHRRPALREVLLRLPGDQACLHLASKLFEEVRAV